MNNSDQNSFDSAAATAYCEECGAKINSSAKFCNQCGFKQITETMGDDSITTRKGAADTREGLAAVAGPSEPSAQQSGPSEPSVQQSGVGVRETRRSRFAAFWLGLASVVFMIVGSVGPWAQEYSLIIKGGLEGDGVITLILGLLAGGALLYFILRGRRLWPVLVAMGAGIASGIFAVNDLVNIADISPLATLEWGIIMVAVASGAVVVTTLILWLGDRSSW